MITHLNISLKKTFCIYDLINNTISLKKTAQEHIYTSIITQNLLKNAP
jgi:hypothetical protein